jgi:hypothetical protein
MNNVPLMLNMIKEAKSVYVAALTGRLGMDPVYVEVKKTCLRNCIKAKPEEWDVFWFSLDANLDLDGNKYLFIN